MKIIKITKGYFVLVDSSDYKFLRRRKWQALKHKKHICATRSGHKNGVKKTIYMHREIMGAKRGQQIDHKNGDALDNRKRNLRFCTPSENRINSVHRQNRFELKGITLRPIGNFQVRIQKNGKRIHIGVYKTKKEAAKAYDMAAIKIHGKFARLNFQNNPPT